MHLIYNSVCSATLFLATCTRVFHVCYIELNVKHDANVTVPLFTNAPWCLEQVSHQSREDVTSM